MSCFAVNAACVTWDKTEGSPEVEKRVLETGSFRAGCWLTADFFNDSDLLLQLCLYLHAADSGRKFRLFFGLYPRVEARLRLPAQALQLNAWALRREGALLKPKCGGDTVRPEEVCLLTLEVAAKRAGTVKWRQTPWRISDTEPPLLEKAGSAHAGLLDEIGQAAFRAWPQKTDGAQDMAKGLARQVESAGQSKFPGDWSRWGGWTRKRFGVSGFFRTEHDGNRWWLVDPGGAAFWSAGLNCVKADIESCVTGLEHLLACCPEKNLKGCVNFLGENWQRTFGEKWPGAWSATTIDFLKSIRVNTFGNWSDWQVAAAAGFPYTRPLGPLSAEKVPRIFRDFPDVWHPAFEAECSSWAEQLRESADDPAMIGYFLTNEPTWCFAKQTPASGMLTNTAECFTRRQLVGWLRARHGTDDALSGVWEWPATFQAVETGRWDLVPDSCGFRADMEEFSGLMAAKLFQTMADSCRRVDPNHLNLGARFAFIPHEWMMDALGFFDVFSFNSYSKSPREHGGIISQRLNRPVLIGEWHFGAIDAGQPSGAVETVATQKDKAAAYRNFVEGHAALPWAVGCHWFTLYDQSAIGRLDGECYNIGFLDVCNRPYPELCAAARLTHERIYALAAGTLAPCSDPAQYLPRVSV